jgi:hypothetical protein
MLLMILSQASTLRIAGKKLAFLTVCARTKSNINLS